MVKNYIKRELDFMSQCRLQDILYSFPKFAEPHSIKESFREIKAEALNDIMLAYNHFRNTQNRMTKEG